jgi:hypothetical protein
MFCLPLQSGTDLYLGHQVGAITYQVEQKTSRLWTLYGKI